MKRLVVLSILALAACAAEPPPAATEAVPLPAAVEAPKPVAAAPIVTPEKPSGPATVGMRPHHMQTARPATHDRRSVVYLASYKNEKSALAGFKALAKASPILAKQQPITHNVDLGKKGSWVRLYGMADDDAERRAICRQVGKLVDECGARNCE